jgi:hypothetical protein
MGLHSLKSLSLLLYLLSLQRLLPWERFVSLKVREIASDLHLQISGFEKTLNEISVLNLVLDYDGRFMLQVVG